MNSVTQQSARMEKQDTMHDADQMAKMLPNEILEKVLGYLSHNDLKRALLVCRRWREVGQSWRLWTWAQFRLDEKDLEDPSWPEPLKKLEVTKLQAGGLTLSERFLKERNVGDKVTEFLQAVAESSDLKKMRLTRVDLSAIPKKLVARALSSVEELVLQSTSISSDQATALFTEMHSLRSLHLDAVNLSEVSTELLLKGVNNLRELSINGDFVKLDQSHAVLSSIATTGNLRKLTLSNSNLSSSPRVDPQLLASASRQVEELHLVNCGITRQQAEAVLGSLKLGGKMKVLELKDNCLSQIDANILAVGVNKLVKVILGVSEDQLFHLKNIQMRKILNQSLQRTSLEVLNLGAVDLGYVVNGIWDEELIKKAQKFIPVISYSEFLYLSGGQKPIRSYLEPSLMFDISNF